MVGNLRVAEIRHVFAVLGEDGEFFRLLRVVSNHVGEENRVRASVRDVEFAAQFVRQRVVDAPKGVGEGHARDAGSIVHLFARDGVVCVGVAAGQILKDHLDGFHRQAVGEIGSHDGNIGFNRVGQNVHAGIGNDGFWHGGNKLGVDDRDVRGQFIVGQRVFRLCP